MRKWNSREDMELLDRVFTAIHESRRLEPGTVTGDDPVDMRAMTFPTVSLCKELDLSTVIVSRVTGRQVFANAVIRRVDFGKARLDFSVWNDCHFKEVTFDSASLHSVRFFGCQFDTCSFRSAVLKDASFSVGRSGRETEIVRTVFEKADFRGASCHNPILRSSSFINCKLNGFVFDGPLFDGVEIVGDYDELTLRGVPGSTERNRLRIDLSKASIAWLNADYGIDLTSAILPADGSCIVVTDRVRAVNRICERLSKELGDVGLRVSRMMKGLFSDRAMSPLETSQMTFLVSREMVADFAEISDQAIVTAVFARIRDIAEQEGYLAANS